jgi:hypothetical protein
MKDTKMWKVITHEDLMNQYHFSNHVAWTLNMFQNPLIMYLGKCKSIDIWSYTINLNGFSFRKSYSEQCSIIL